MSPASPVIVIVYMLKFLYGWNILCSESTNIHQKNKWENHNFTKERIDDRRKIWFSKYFLKVSMFQIIVKIFDTCQNPSNVSKYMFFFHIVADFCTTKSILENYSLHETDWKSHSFTKERSVIEGKYGFSLSSVV